MDYKKNAIIFRVILFAVLTVISFTKCAQRKQVSGNTYYIELINFNDSLGNYISSNSFGKVVFYKNGQLQIISQNFLTEEYPEMHYLEGVAATKNIYKSGAIKIRAEFIGNYTVDSIRYSLQKYKYEKSQWNKISDMGSIKAVTTYKKAKQFSVAEFGKQIVYTIAGYTFE